MTQKNFAITGVAGHVAPRHLQAIRDNGHRLIAALDPHDAVGVLDRFSLGTLFFTEPERFDRHLERLRRGPEEHRVHWLSVCSPNHLHDAHCRLGLRVRADVLCEKPLVLSPWNLDALEALEAETGHRVYTVLQLRAHDALVALRDRIRAEGTSGRRDVVLSYVTARGPWYDVSWKGHAEKSGGIGTNIGIHLFDLVLWLFGGVVDARVHLSSARRMAGHLELERARVRWFLSVDAADLPAGAAGPVHRAIVVDGSEVEFSSGFGELHTRVYERTLAGRGFGLSDARPSIELAHRLRGVRVTAAGTEGHPWLR